ncbi:MAG TPA: ABC transporter ATP-binding protein, partial [Patescibacteria group bacterium]|nr:ABC transporter ATP-binding protein [Patescibacteria group bacterium]
MIEVKNLTKKFGDTKALDGIDFTVNKGEILGFLGPNGAGKTTAMKILTSFWPQDDGEVKIDDQDIKTHSLETRKKIGYLPETVPLYEDMTVYEYLKFVASVRDIKKADINDKIREVAGSCGLQNVLKKAVEELSKGYRQRLGLAQAIIHDPEVLILDEP